jgi:NTE family protein
VSDEPTKVAVACQGGGSHTAFTAGVLRHVLERRERGYELVAFTGTSGGSLCALTAWYGLHTGDAETARAALRDLWEDVAARGVTDALLNFGVVSTSRLLHSGVPIPQLSPARSPGARIARRRLRRAIETQVDPEVLAELVAAPGEEPPPPKLLISAVDATDGTFEIFTDRPVPSSTTGATAPLEEHPKPLSIDAVLASAAVPNLFEPVRMRDSPDGAVHAYWDGLLSQNPPIRNLLDGPDRAARKPDEIWLVRINPTVQRGDLSALDEIADRRNELAGSLSLAQELYFVKQVNQWLADGTFAAATRETYKPVTVRQLELDETRLDGESDLRTASKLDRSPAFIRELMALGERQAAEFLDARDRDENVLVGTDP